MDQAENKTTRRGSIIVVATLVALALAGIMAVRLAGAGGDALVAKVTQDGNVVALLPLDTDARQEFSCEDGHNTVVVEGGAVHIEEADCPGGDCMRQGSINLPSQLLVCLPHQLIVEIVPENGDGSAPSVYTGNEAVGSSGIDAIAR